MLVYAIGQQGTIHNFPAFLTQFMSSAFSSSMANIFTSPDGSPALSNDGNSPFAGLGISNTDNSFGDFSESFNSMDFGNPGLPPNSFGDVPESDSHKTGFAKNFGNSGKSKREASKGIPTMGLGDVESNPFFSAFDPVYGYSFFLGWVGFVLALAACILCGIGILKIARESELARDIAMK